MRKYWTHLPECKQPNFQSQNPSGKSLSQGVGGSGTQTSVGRDKTDTQNILREGAHIEEVIS